MKWFSKIKLDMYASTTVLNVSCGLKPRDWFRRMSSVTFPVMFGKAAIVPCSL